MAPNGYKEMSPEDATKHLAGRVANFLPPISQFTIEIATHHVGVIDLLHASNDAIHNDVLTVQKNSIERSVTEFAHGVGITTKAIINSITSGDTLFVLERIEVDGYSRAMKGIGFEVLVQPARGFTPEKPQALILIVDGARLSRWEPQEGQDDTMIAVYKKLADDLQLPQADTFPEIAKNIQKHAISFMKSGR